MPLTKPRAYQIYDIDYKQSVRVVTISNVTLSGGAPNAVDGVNLSLNDRILVTGQTNPVQNGIYYVTALGAGSNGTWARSIDTDTTGELEGGTIVMVTEGLIYADTQWKLTTNDPIVIGATGLTFVQNYLANSISFGQTSFAIGSANANATVSVAGTSNIAVFTTTGAVISGTITATGNVTGGNVNTSGVISTSGNIIGGNVNSVGGTFTGNVNFGNVFVGGYYWANGVVFAGGGGGGSPGGANTQVQFNDNGVFNGSAGLTFNKTTNAVSVTGNITSTANVAGGNVIQGGIRVARWTTTTTTPANAVQGDQWYDSDTDKRYLYVNDGTSNVWVDQSQTTSFSTLAVTGAATFGSTLGVTGNITAGNLSVGTGTITFGSATNAGANGVGNIGSATGFFNTVFARATSALYADVAEWYTSDADYTPGTVVVFGGTQEVTLATSPGDSAVAGVVSTNPAYIMNSGLDSQYKVPVALMGRVPTKVTGTVRKGNMMVSAGNGYAHACATPAFGTVIGKAIEDFNGDVGIIEIVVGRM
jgi:hypothetical protein